MSYTIIILYNNKKRLSHALEYRSHQVIFQKWIKGEFRKKYPHLLSVRNWLEKNSRKSVETQSVPNFSYRWKVDTLILVESFQELFICGSYCHTQFVLLYTAPPPHNAWVLDVHAYAGALYEVAIQITAFDTWKFWSVKLDELNIL